MGESLSVEHSNREPGKFIYVFLSLKNGHQDNYQDGQVVYGKTRYTRVTLKCNINILYLSVCLPPSLSLSLSRISVYLSIFLSICMSVCLSLSLSFCMCQYAYVCEKGLYMYFIYRS